MNEPRKPIFGFLWSSPDPQAPVDGDYRQVRLLRVSGRGPVRVAMLVVGTIATVMLAGSVLMATFATAALGPTVVAGAVCATSIVLVLRGWVVGTFVTDDVVRVETTWRRVQVPWSEVAAIQTAVQPCPFLGLPVRTSAARSVLHLADGRVLPTHLYGTSPDLWLRPEAFDAACLRLERWRDHA